MPYDPDRDSLGDYLRSLRRIEELDPGRTLPGHGEPLVKGGARAREIALHHDERLRAVARATAGRTADAWGVTTRVFGARLDPIGSILALLETLSHLEHLVCTGRMTKRVKEGLWYYGE